MEPHRAGYFGKLPARGDFIQATLPADFVAAWDARLQEMLHQAEAAAPDTWLEKYLAMPIWHFSLAAGVCGEAPIVGILLSSADSVGRYFPLTIAVVCPAESGEAGLPLLLADRFDLGFALEDIGLAALQPGALLEDFEAQIESLGLPKKCRFLTSAEAQDGSTSMAQTLIRQGLLSRRANWEGASLWWARSGDETRVHDEDGLPNPERFATMLLGIMKMNETNIPVCELPAAAALETAVSEAAPS